VSFYTCAITAICGSAFLAASAGGAMGQVQEAVPDQPAAAVSDTAASAESLAKANEELATLRAEYERLRLQTEALGLAGLKPELRPLQERLLAAVSDYRLADRRAKQLTEQVVSLSEASLALLSDPQDQISRDRLQQELATANQALVVAKSETMVASTPLESAKVISLKNDLGLAVINTGAESGLRLGTPMRLVRGEKIVATGLVVDVRSRIAGLLMTTTSSAGALKVGDLAKPETISTLK
jgi:hypothetical protein